MNTCKHSTWLKLRGNGSQVALEASDLPQRLIPEMDNADDPIASALLIGSRTKNLFITALGVNRRTSKIRAGHGECHIHHTRILGRDPFLLVEGGIPTHNKLPVPCKTHTCHEITTNVMVEVAPKAIDAANDIYSRIVFPLVDVVCVFVADIGGISKALRHLETWAARGRTSTCPIPPALLLVVPKGQKSIAETALSESGNRESPELLSQFFQSIRVVSLPQSTNQAKQYHSVRNELLHLAKAVQASKQQSGWLFSALHVTEFLRAIADSVPRSPKKRFDFIKASRANRLPNADLGQHLLAFLKNCGGSICLEYTLPLIASSFILDQYPPGMHGESNWSGLVLDTNQTNSLQPQGRFPDVVPRYMRGSEK